MLQLYTVLKENPDKARLILAVLNHIGISDTLTVLQSSPSAGFPGFIYPHETAKFYSRHRKAINAWIFEHALSIGATPVKYCTDLSLHSWDDHHSGVTETLFQYCFSEHKLEYHAADIEPAMHFLSLWALLNVCKLFHLEIDTRYIFIQ